jgi:ubiquinone biosynthesis protein Coq4
MELLSYRHGKGPHDGARTYLKQAIKKEQFKPKGENLQNVHDVVLYLQRTMGQSHDAYEGAKKDVK